MKKTDIIFEQGDTISYNSLRHCREKTFLFIKEGFHLETVENVKAVLCRLVLFEKKLKYWRT